MQAKRSLAIVIAALSSCNDEYHLVYRTKTYSPWQPQAIVRMTVFMLRWYEKKDISSARLLRLELIPASP